jgi:hypothetical protein
VQNPQPGYFSNYDTSVGFEQCLVDATFREEPVFQGFSRRF